MTMRAISPFIWLVAFLSSLFFIPDMDLEMFGAAIILLYIWAVTTLSPLENWQIPKSWCFRIMGLFWLLLFASIFRSDVLNVSVMSFCFIGVLPLSFLVTSFAAEERDLKIIKVAMVIIFGLLALGALAQFFIFNDWAGGRAHWPLNNPNSLAALFIFPLFASIGAMLCATNKVAANVGLVLAALIFGGIVATGSRGALFALIPALGFYLFMLRAQAKQHVKCLGLLAVLCAALFGLSALGAAGNDNLIARVGDTLAMNLQDVTSNRLSLWAATIEMIKAHGVLGTGIGTYFLYFPEFRLSDDLSGAYYAHSDPLQYWVELGIIGPVLFYAFMIAVIGRTVMALKQTNDPVVRLRVLTPFCAAGAVILHTHVTFNLYNLSILFTLSFFLALWFRATQEVLKTPTKEIIFPKGYSCAARAFAIALPFIMIGGLFSAYIASEHFTNRARDALFRGDLQVFSDNVIRAFDISFNGNYRAYLLAVNIPLTLLEEGKNLTQEEKRDVFDQALLYLRHVRNINPRSSSALYYLGKIQQVSPKEFIPEDLKSPEEYYEDALKIDPLHLGARMALADIVAARGDKDKALTILEGGFDYHYGTPTVMDYYGRLMQVYLQNGNQEGQQRALQKMRSFQSRLEKQKMRQQSSIQERFGIP